MMKKISLASADIPLKAWLNVIDCLKSERIGRGKYVNLLEERACDYFNVEHCIAVGNGTLADIIILATLKEMYPGKTEVILPAFTFIAHANAVVWNGLKPVFVDVTGDYQMNWAKIEPNHKTLCVFPVHLIGKYSGWRPIQTWPIIEDCCEAMGGMNGLNKFGTLGLAGSFSMYPSHTITTGEGGLIITNDDTFHEIARSIHNHGKWGTQDFNFKYIGINAKMTNLQAAIGCELISKIDGVNLQRCLNVEIYNSILGYDFYASAPHCYPIIYKNKEDRDSALKVLAENGVEARKLMGCIPTSEPYIRLFGSDNSSHYPNSQRFADCGLFLPIHQKLKKSDIERICRVLPKP